jgi:hypothetical protein
MKWSDAVEMLKMASKVQYNHFGERTAAEEAEWWENNHELILKGHPEVRRQNFDEGNDIF